MPTPFMELPAVASAETHWLTDVAAHAGLELDLGPLPDNAALRHAWPVVARACKVSDDELAHRVARHFRLGVADLTASDPQAVALLPEKVARAHGILALSMTDTTVVVATSDPASREARQDIVAYAGRQPVFLMASPTAMADAIDGAYAPSRSVHSALHTLVTEAASSGLQIVGQGTGGITRFELEAPAVVKLTEVILQQAARYHASEIHLEPGRESGRVRYRIDGVLQHFLDLPVQAHNRVVARLKSMAQRPSATREGPSAIFTLPVRGGGSLEAHLRTTPTPDGERGSIHLTDPDAKPTLETLGFDGPEGTKLRGLLALRDGFILVTGPARSGKTSLIHAVLAGASGLNVVSLENPVELLLPGVTQVQFDPGSGHSYAEALQQLMGLDPDLIHAGEVRDLPTARAVIRAAVTGRRVLATVHTGDAVAGLRRMLDLGLAPGRVAESLRGVVSIRLVRRLCPACAKPVSVAADLSPRERQLAEAVGNLPARRAVGCRECGGTGYQGQLPLTEVLPMTHALCALAETASGPELDQAARGHGMRTFLEVALERVARGQTSLQEVERVLGLLPQRQMSAASVGPVLVVDDDAADRRLVAAALEEMGFKVMEAGDGPPALALLEPGQRDFSMVILNLFMPEMHGMEVLKHIRSSLATQSLPVIVLTASPNPRDEIELLDAGADDYILKPIVKERLEARARAVFRRMGIHLTEAGATAASATPV
jgi:type II secretory ATPase GspE/PulE/Tfp pilus assembly ATPase PilB-like protein/CheY-like chemotaxis protein